MRAVVNKSKRKLTKKHLVVDWRGFGNLFYRMTPLQAQALFNGSEEVEVSYTLGVNDGGFAFFEIDHQPGGKMAVGCEKFNREEVRELKRWVKGGKK